jgi:hypothetical protein
MRNLKTLTLVAIGATAALVFLAPARAQVSECRVLGNWAGWGQNGTGTFDVTPGGSCTIGATTFGHFEGSKVAKKPQHGTVKQLSLSSWQYTAKPGFTGTDSFVLEGTGHDPSQPAGQRSLVTMNVNVK